MLLKPMRLILGHGKRMKALYGAIYEELVAQTIVGAQDARRHER